jgi:hypothetical protein
MLASGAWLVRGTDDLHDQQPRQRLRSRDRSRDENPRERILV